MSVNFTPSLRAVVSRMFENAPDRREKIRTNPVTGGRFVPGFDPVQAQEHQAVLALAARHHFYLENPGLPELPLSYETREDLKGESALGYLVSLYARSWAATDYSAAHPSFSDYASAVLASPYKPTIRLCGQEYDQLARKYPPRFSLRLGPGCYWE